MSETRILCFGNRWHGDDGFGPAVYDYLQNPFYRQKDQQRDESKKGEQRIVFEAGIMGLNSLALFENCQQVIIVDAIKSQAALSNIADIVAQQIGELFYLPAESFISPAKSESPHHDFNLAYLLQALPLVMAMPLPKIHILGVLIEEITAFQTGLSNPVQVASERAGKLLQQGKESMLAGLG